MSSTQFWPEHLLQVFEEEDKVKLLLDSMANELNNSIAQSRISAKVNSRKITDATIIGKGVDNDVPPYNGYFSIIERENSILYNFDFELTSKKSGITVLFFSIYRDTAKPPLVFMETFNGNQYLFSEIPKFTTFMNGYVGTQEVMDLFSRL